MPELHLRRIFPCFRASTLTATLLAAPIALAAFPAAAVEAPEGFHVSVAASGLPDGTSMQFAPDGRLFICRQNGVIRVVKDGRLLAEPFLRINVDSAGERGLLGLAFDPGFLQNGHFYVYYTAPDPVRRNRVCRFTAAGDRAIPSSERLLLDLDRLPVSGNHNGGALHVGPDGLLYIATGDLANPANAPSLRSLSGKILRIRRDGSIPAGNPFYRTATGNYRSIWARGLRNPFTFAFDPGAGRMFINDVGQDAFEEINLGVAGADYGWPATEGPTRIPGYRSPLFAYPHAGNEPTGCAITGGAFYRSDRPAFPAEYVGRYFFADFCGGWIRALNPATGTDALFATEIPNPVDLKVGPDGALYCLSRGDAAVYRIAWAAADAPALNAVSIQPRRVRRGRRAKVKLFFTSPVREDTTVNLSSPQADRINFPGQVTVPKGSARLTFRIRARRGASPGAATLRAETGGVLRSATITVRR